MTQTRHRGDCYASSRRRVAIIAEVRTFLFVWLRCSFALFNFFDKKSCINGCDVIPLPIQGNLRPRYQGLNLCLWMPDVAKAAVDMCEDGVVRIVCYIVKPKDKRMKKLFALFGALLLWQSVAVAQNVLHIWTGDSTRVVRMAELDSVTVRDGEFYTPTYLCEGAFYDSFFYEEWLDVAVYTLGDTYIVKEALVGRDLTFTYDSNSGMCVVKEQVTGYNHSTYGMIRVRGNGYYEENECSFRFNLEYIVDAGSFGTYGAILQLPVPTASARDRKKENAEPRVASELKATLQFQKTEGEASHQQLKPMTTREITQ